MQGEAWEGVQDCGRGRGNAGGIVKCGYCANGLGDSGGIGGVAGVVLDATADCNVLQACASIRCG